MGLLSRVVAFITGTSDLAPDEVQNWLDDAADMGDVRLDRYAKYEEYYDGEYKVKLRDRTRRYLESAGSSLIGFKENFSDVVVDVMAERLKVIGFAASNAEEDKETGEINDPIGSLLEEWWQNCRWDGLQATSHTEALKLGDGGLAVDWNAEKGKPELCFNHPRGLKFVYEDDAPDRLAYVVKLWNTSKVGPSNPNGIRVQRLNVYWPDKIEKWFRLSSREGQPRGGWAQWSDEGDESWPVDWTNDKDEPLGIPIFHLKHRAQSRTWGRSRLHNVIPFQDELNKTVVDLNELVDAYPAPQRWISGVTGDMDIKQAPGNILKLTSAESKAGEFTPGDTTSLLNAIEGVLSRLARKTRIPMHLLTGGTNPSGEALKSAESGLVAQAEAAQVEFGNVWEGAMMMALKLAIENGAEGVPELPPDLTLDVQWDTVETRNGKEELEALLLKQTLGFSKYTLIREAGGDPEKESERRAGEQEEAAKAYSQALDAGQGFGGP